MKASGTGYISMGGGIPASIQVDVDGILRLSGGGPATDGGYRRDENQMCLRRSRGGLLDYWCRAALICSYGCRSEADQVAHPWYTRLSEGG